MDSCLSREILWPLSSGARDPSWRKNCDEISLAQVHAEGFSHFCDYRGGGNSHAHAGPSGTAGYPDRPRGDQRRRKQCVGYVDATYPRYISGRIHG